MSCIYIDKCPSASGWCSSRNEPKGDCAGFLITAYQNLKENMKSKGKPPLGVKPRNIHDTERMDDLVSAIARYISAGYTIPYEWVKELTELCEMYPKNKNNSFLWFVSAHFKIEEDERED